MANSIVKLQVEDNSFNAKIREAARTFADFGRRIANVGMESMADFARGLKTAKAAMEGFNAAIKANAIVLLATLATKAASSIIDLGRSILTASDDASDGMRTMDEYRASIENLGNAAEIAKYKIADLINLKINEAKITELTGSFNKNFQDRTAAEQRMAQIDGGLEWYNGQLYYAEQLRKVLQDKIDRANVGMINDQALIRLYSGQNSNINKTYEPTKSAPTPRGGGGGGGSSKEFTSSMKFTELGAQTMEVTTSMKELQAQLNAYKQQLSTATNQFDYNAAQQGIEETQKRINAQPLAIRLGIDVDSAVELEASINDRIERMRSEIKPLEISVDSSQTVRDVNAITKGAKIASQAIGTIGQAFNAIEDPAAKIAATVAQAIASVALAYADAMAKDQTQKFNIFGFIAASAAAMISMATTIAAIHKQTGYALGGVVGGNSYSGDNVGPVMLDAGEVVLNRAQTYALASQLQNNEQGGNSFTTVSGEQLVIAINNYGRRRGMGELIRI